MLVQLFTALSGALQSAPSIAIAAAFAWGVLSILLSPCHLSSIPLIVGFINGQSKVDTKRAFLLSVLFSSGILLSIILIGVVTSMAGRIVGDTGPMATYLVAIVFFAVGLNLMGILPLPFLNAPAQPAFNKKGFAAAFFLGLVFGVALGPCTFAFMAPVLGTAFAVSATSVLFAVSLVTVFALGHCSVIVFAGTSAELVQRYLNWHERSKAADTVKKMCGALVIAGGVYLLWR